MQPSQHKFKPLISEKILLHLKNWPRYEHQIPPLAVTQQGIADAVKIRINHVPRAMRELHEKGYLEETKDHVVGLQRKRKVYFLTEKGVSLAAEISERLRNSQILLRNAEGDVEKIKVYEVNNYLGESEIKLTLLEIINHISDGIFDYRTFQETMIEKEEVQLLQSLEKAPVIEDFFGRENELELMNGWIESLDTNIIITYGEKGIGKSHLVSKVMLCHKPKWNMLWYQFYDWSALEDVLHTLAKFLHKLDRRKLKYHLLSKEEIDVNKIANILQDELRNTNTICVFDNFLSANKKLIQAFSLILEIVNRIDGFKIIITTRDEKLIDNYREYILNKKMGVINLGGLDEEDSNALLRSQKVDEGEFKMIYTLTKGNPLALKLLNSKEVLEGIDSEGLTPEEYSTIKCLKAMEIVFKES